MASDTIVGLVDIVGFDTVIVTSSLLSYRINGKKIVEKCKSIRAVFAKSLAGNLLIGQTMFLSKITMQRI